MKTKRRFVKIEDAQEVAKANNGKCLSPALDKGIMSKLEWECDKGHRWIATFNNVKNMKQWCRICNGHPVLSIADAHAEAAKHGGKCLSTAYCDNITPLEWECAQGHHWSAALVGIRNCGTWCMKCHYENSKGSSFSIETARELARQNGGECLSESYIDIYSKLSWRCNKGHEWQANLNAIKNNHYWCRKCQGDKAKTTFLKNYGVDNPMKCREIHLKAARRVNNAATVLHWKTNEEIVCRGSWEKNVVAHLNANQVDYDWQIPFSLSDGRTYIIDFLDRSRNVYVEIKGWWREDAKEKFELFRKEYPDLKVEVWAKEELQSKNIPIK